MNWPTKRVNSYPTPWNSLTLHRSIDDLLEDFFGGSTGDKPLAGIAPRFDVSETDGAVLIEAELPGLDEKEIELTLKNNVLTLKGEKKREEETETKTRYISERSYGHFQRSIQIGSEVDDENVQASFKNGVLTIRIPKLEPEKTQARRIDIQTT